MNKLFISLLAIFAILTLGASNPAFSKKYRGDLYEQLRGNQSSKRVKVKRANMKNDMGLQMLRGIY